MWLSNHDDLEHAKQPPAGGRAYTIRFQVLSPLESGEWDIVLSKDIGPQGAHFDYRLPLKPETLLSFKINLGFGERPIECTGKVLQCEPLNHSSNFYRVVSEFFEMGRTESNRLKAQMERPSPEPPKFWLE